MNIKDWWKKNGYSADDSGNSVSLKEFARRVSKPGNLARDVRECARDWLRNKRTKK